MFMGWVVPLYYYIHELHAHHLLIAQSPLQFNQGTLNYDVDAQNEEEIEQVQQDKHRGVIPRQATMHGHVHSCDEGGRQIRWYYRYEYTPVFLLGHLRLEGGICVLCSWIVADCDVSSLFRTYAEKVY